MQLVSQAIKRSDDTLGQIGIDVEALKRNALEFARSVKDGIHTSFTYAKQQAAHSQEGEKSGKTTKELEKHTSVKSRSELRHERAIHYELIKHSWQHNLKNGLISLFSGLGLGILLYYLGRTAINSGTVADIEQLVEHQVRGIEQLLSMLWLFALIPALKGFAQLIYAAFSGFSGQSIAKLTERFPAPQQQVQEPEYFTMPSLGEPPSSVTDHTTELFEESTPKFKREAQTQ
jgi:hypothetical protein